ncbi:hypothetical protein BHE74_00025100 [Ensete ventricosum]|nr:hypothetical protein GW17_00059597 [Ensete ventricosum]RWW67455.1 hypothetical protein BHE74_00025100 [Ensete ventricosum]
MAGEGTPQGIATGRCRAAEHREETDLDGAMVAVMVGETEGAEGAVGAVEAVHVALALVRVGVDRALNEEPRRQKRPQPRRPATVLLRHSTALYSRENCECFHVTHDDALLRREGSYVERFLWQ